VPRLRSRACCSGWGRFRPGYDQLPTRVWLLNPLGLYSLGLIYTRRRVHCPTCGGVAEKLPWASGKHPLTEGFGLFLAHWARKLSWQEVARSFGVAWADVYASVRWGVDYGLAHRSLAGIVAVGVDEGCVRPGRIFWTLLYQIDAGGTRLLWIGHARQEQTLRAGLAALGASVCAGWR
jgi:transposase